MVRDGNVADLPLLFCLKRRVVQTVLAARLRTEGRIVELVNVDVVGLECAQAGLKVAPEALGGLRAGLGRQHDPVAHPGKGRADLLLAVGIRAGGVEEIDAAVAGLVQQLHRLRLADALNGQAAEAVLFDHKAGGAEFDLLHRCHPPLIIR